MGTDGPGLIAVVNDIIPLEAIGWTQSFQNFHLKKAFMLRVKYL